MCGEILSKKEDITLPFSLGVKALALLILGKNGVQQIYLNGDADMSIFHTIIMHFH